MTDARPVVDPRLVVRDAIAAVIDAKMRTERLDDHFDGGDYADAVLELFEVSEEALKLGTQPGVDGPVDMRMMSDYPVTHTRLVLRSEPVPVETGRRAAVGGVRAEYPVDPDGEE